MNISLTHKINIMDISTAKNIPLEQVLYRMGIHPQKRNGSRIWFLSPLNKERTPSFKIDTDKNRWYCHSNGFGGNTVDLVVRLSNCTIKEALVYLKDFNVFFSFQPQASKPVVSTNQIEKVIPIQHFALIQYLQSRGITKNIDQLKEVHYSINEKKYFAIGFESRSGGFELRSKYTKISLGKKDITKISNQSQILAIFEGFFDYLSFIQIRDTKKMEKSDYLILNSVALVTKNFSLLNDYKVIELYLDNDPTGHKYTNIILENFENAIDFRGFFYPFKDLNEWFINRKS